MPRRWRARSRTGSSTKSPSELSSSSPTGVSSDTGSERDALDLAHPVGRELDLRRDLVDGRLASELLQHLALDAQHLVHRLDHVHRDADGARLVGDRARDGLADPPRRVGGELEALRVVELLDRTDQPEVALLHEVEQRHAPPDVALGDRHDEAQVGLGELLLGELAVGCHGLQRRLRSRRTAALRLVLEPLGGVQPGLDALGERHLLLGGEQRDLADLLEVHADRVEAAALGALGGERGHARVDALGVAHSAPGRGTGATDRLALHDAGAIGAARRHAPARVRLRDGCSSMISSMTSKPLAWMRSKIASARRCRARVRATPRRSHRS